MRMRQRITHRDRRRARTKTGTRALWRTEPHAHLRAPVTSGRPHKLLRFRGLARPRSLALISRRSLVRVQPPLSVPRDDLDVSRGYFMRYVNLRGFITGKKTAVHNGWPLPWAHNGEVVGSKGIDLTRLARRCVLHAYKVATDMPALRARGYSLTLLGILLVSSLLSAVAVISRSNPDSAHSAVIDGGRQ